jgi:DNA-binding transcriptional ArsR family regulator
MANFLETERQEVATLFEGLAFAGKFFLTRIKGEQAYKRLEARFSLVPEGKALLLVFPPEQMMDVSFVDETIIQLGQAMLDGHYPGRSLILQGLTQDSVSNIEAAIDFRALKMGFLLVEPDGTWQCIGHLDLSSRETLQILYERESLTAAELAEILQVAINAASTRLKRLYDLHLIRRHHEIGPKGLQYIYTFWKWTEK